MLNWLHKLKTTEKLQRDEDQLHNSPPSTLNSSPIPTSFPLGRVSAGDNGKQAGKRLQMGLGHSVCCSLWQTVQVSPKTTVKTREDRHKENRRHCEPEDFWYYKDECRTEIPNVSYNQRNLDVLSECFYRAFLPREIHTWPRRAWQGCRMLSQRWHCSNAHHAQPLLLHDPATPRSISEVQKEKRNEALQNILKEKLLCDQETPFKM